MVDGGRWLNEERNHHSTSVGKMANFDHQNKFQQIYRSDRGDKCGLIKPEIMNFGGPVLEI